MGPVLEPSYSLGSSLGGVSSCAGSHTGLLTPQSMAATLVPSQAGCGVAGGGSSQSGGGASGRGHHHLPSLPPVIEGHDEAQTMATTASGSPAARVGSADNIRGSRSPHPVEGLSHSSQQQPQHLTKQLLLQLPPIARQLPDSFLEGQPIPNSAQSQQQYGYVPPSPADIARALKQASAPHIGSRPSAQVSLSPASSRSHSLPSQLAGTSSYGPTAAATATSLR